MLGTCFFTLTAADTFTGLSVFQGKVVVINRLAGKTACGAGNAVVQSKILGNSDIFRTSVGTVGAAGTWYSYDLFNRCPALLS